MRLNKTNHKTQHSYSWKLMKIKMYVVKIFTCDFYSSIIYNHQELETAQLSYSD